MRMLRLIALATGWMSLSLASACTQAEPEADSAPLAVAVSERFAIPPARFHVHVDGTELLVEAHNYDIAPGEDACEAIEQSLDADSTLAPRVQRIRVVGAPNFRADEEPTRSYPICTLDRTSGG
ncbi:MAG: hypothetical protein Rubg2KO_14490 [Rubricoccaceae bacterium]